MFSSERSTAIRGMVLASAFLFQVLPLSAEEPALTLGSKDARRTVEVKVGGTFSIRLSAQLGTGYGWQLKAPDGAVLAQEGEAKVEPISKGAKTMAGGSEYQVFRFAAKGPGKADLEFQYSRPFEPGKKPLRTATFHIKVVEAKP